MDTCVESLYTLDGGATDKRKTLAMIRILKGAVSESKSKAGQAVRRYNKHDKKALKRQLTLLDNDASRTEIDVDNQKRVILRKWSMVFENQKNTSDSLKRFDEMLRAAIADTIKDDDVEDVQEETSEKRVQDCTEGSRILNRPTFKDRDNLTGNRLNNPSVMPKLPNSGFLVQTSTSKSIEEKHEHDKNVSHVTSSFPSLVNDFLEDQKLIQEQLLTRNKLCKLKKTVDREHTFYKLRMKSKLPSDPASLLLKIEKDRLLPRRTADRHFRYQSLDNLRDVTHRSPARSESRSLIQIPQTVDRSDSERPCVFHPEPLSNLPTSYISVPNPVPASVNITGQVIVADTDFVEIDLGSEADTQPLPPQSFLRALLSRLIRLVKRVFTSNKNDV